MQYILTEHEYKKLTDEPKLVAKNKDEIIFKLCQQVADNLAFDWGREDGPKPWGCIKSTDHEWYCDQCPVKEFCPNEWKHWSK